MQRIGYVGVDVFFFLSGIGLTYAIQKNDVFAFYVRRLKRIIPSFLIIGIIIGVLNSWGLKVFVKKITGYGFLFESIYSFLWFVPAIMILYLVFPWLYMFLNKAGDIITGIFTIIVIWLFISI